VADVDLSLSLILPCHGGVPDTTVCLAALAEQRGAPPFEVVLVDDGSPAAAAEELDRAARRSALPVQVVRRPERGGFAAAVNDGCARARGTHVVVLNNDTLPAPRLLAELLAAFQECGARVAAPVSNRVKGRARLAVGGTTRERGARLRLEAHLATCPPAEDVETASGLCLLMRRDDLAALGGFDTRFGSGNWEDDDLCLRVRREGGRIVIARRAFVHHEGHRTFQALGLDPEQAIRTRFATFAAKWSRCPVGRAYLAILRGDLAAAAAAAHEARASWPLWPDAAWILAREAFARGAFDAARSELLRFLGDCPLHGEARLLLARGALVTGMHGDARRALAFAAHHCWLDAAQIATLERLAAAVERSSAGRGRHASESTHDVLDDPVEIERRPEARGGGQAVEARQAPSCIGSARGTPRRVDDP